MNFLPKIPTDNLYRFMAISGVWMMGFVIIFIMYIGYLKYQIEKESAEVNNYYTSKYLSLQIKYRLESISKGEIGKNIIDIIPVKDGSINEITYLKKLDEILHKEIQEYKENNKAYYFRNFELIEETGLIWVITALSSISIIFLFFGFKYWNIHIQKPKNELILKDIEIRKLTITKMKLEIDLINKSKNSYRKQWMGRN